MNTLRFIALGAVFFNLANIQAMQPNLAADSWMLNANVESQLIAEQTKKAGYFVLAQQGFQKGLEIAKPYAKSFVALPVNHPYYAAGVIGTVVIAGVEHYLFADKHVVAVSDAAKAALNKVVEFKKTSATVGLASVAAASGFVANKLGYLPKVSMPSFTMPKFSMPSVSMETAKNAAFAAKNFGSSIVSQGYNLVKTYPKTAATVAALGGGAYLAKKYFGKSAEVVNPQVTIEVKQPVVQVEFPEFRSLAEAEVALMNAQGEAKAALKQHLVVKYPTYAKALGC